MVVISKRMKTVLSGELGAPAEELGAPGQTERKALLIQQVKNMEPAEPEGPMPITILSQRREQEEPPVEGMEAMEPIIILPISEVMLHFMEPGEEEAHSVPDMSMVKAVKGTRAYL
jgi:hypothetical protein